MTYTLPKAALLAICLMPFTVASAAEPDVELGKELYGDYCQNCHGIDKAALSDYSGSLAEFTERLEGMTNDMPDFGGFFDDDEILGLHAYMVADDAD